MKYKINRDQEPLTDGELSSARNFNNIYKGYNAMKIPFYRRGRFLTRGSAIIVAVAVTMIVLFDDKAETPANKFISPPFAQATIPIDSSTIDADSTTDIEYKSGSKLHIPAGAFRDAKGNLIKGKVILSYREFHDQEDIFLSGIPMIYDSAGSKYVFESAGMMEIGATQDGKSLAANPDNPIQVEMVSNTKENHYNTYYLDTMSKKWVNLNQLNFPQSELQYPDANNDVRIKQTDLVFRTFVVAKLGVYNAGCPHIWPSKGGAVATFKSEKGDKLDLSCVYLVTRGVNIVYPFYGGNGECANFKFDSSKSNALWAVTKDNRLVMVDINTFKASHQNDNKIEFKFKMADKEFKSSDEVKKYLEI